MHVVDDHHGGPTQAAPRVEGSTRSRSRRRACTAATSARAIPPSAAFAERMSQDDALQVDNEAAYPLFAAVFAADDLTRGTRFNTSHFPR